MKKIRLDRLRRMSAHEWRWRGQDALHTVVERVRMRTGAARWKRKDVSSVLTAPARDACGDDLRRENWAGVQDALAAHIAARPARFVLDPSSATAMCDQVLARWPGAARDAAARADRILDGTYDLLGYRRVRAGDGRIDWHADPVHGRRAPHIFYADVPFLSPEVGDHKIVWELNRHQHWLQLGRAYWLTGDARYAQRIGSELESWLADNQPYVGINWASMLEIGFRAISWTWALHCLLATPNPQPPIPNPQEPWLIDMLVGLDRQLTHVERHLSYYFSPNTHLTGEALALYVAGTALPELASSHRWLETGRRILLHEIDRQILADGGHVERSTHYQRYTLDFYLLAALTARLGRDEAAGRRFEEAAGRLARFTRAIADEDGRLPLIGDDDGGMLWPMIGRPADDVRDSLAVAAVVLGKPDLAAWGVPEEAFWIAGPRASADVRPTRLSAPRSCLLRETGYFVARDAGRSHAVVDAGPHGYQNGGHAHADALSLTLSIDGRPLLIDPGTSTYTMDAALRDRMRSSASHNTVTLDGRSQSLPDGPFHWRSRVDARVIVCRINPAFDVFEAVHDGYLPARHRRTVVRTANAGWLIVDAILDAGQRHSAAARWHFDPAWQVTASGRRLRATHGDGASVWMLCEGGDVTVVRGDDEGDGWCAPVYGQLVPSSTARVNATAEAPFVLVTWIGSAREFRSPTLRCTQLSGPDTGVIVDVDDGARTATFLVRSADPSRPRAVCRVGEFETDAAMFHYVTANGRLESISMIDGQHAVSSHDAWPSLSADEPVPDVHLFVRDDEIDLTRVASALRRTLRVHGTAGLHIAPGERTRITT